MGRERRKEEEEESDGKARQSDGYWLGGDVLFLLILVSSNPKASSLSC